MVLLLLLQTLASPLSGILGDRYNRVAVLSTGAFIWGIMTSAMALTVTLHQVRCAGVAAPYHTIPYVRGVVMLAVSIAHALQCWFGYANPCGFANLLPLFCAGNDVCWR
jgi:MFS family permease